MSHFCPSEPPSFLKLSPPPSHTACSMSTALWSLLSVWHVGVYGGGGVAAGWVLLGFRAASGSDRLDSYPILPSY